MVTLPQLLAKLPLACCWLCAEPLLAHERLGFCRTCYSDLPRLPPSCVHWRAPAQAQALGRHWFAALAWQADSRQLVQDFKFRRRPDLVHWLAPILAAQLQACYRQQGAEWPDLVVAMPMSRSRWRQRGYNQAALLAQEVAELLQVPFAAGMLRRLHDEAKQHQLGRQARWQNMVESLHCTRSVEGLSVAVVDDVITTGASMTAATAALLRRGATVVDAWALCFNEPHAPGQVE
ncbi:ComF family protein [Pseudidiomarina atlantica]|uniref:ComF family protein n=1 Tax=Pseudidiomarina atlantica TaxID=1517416 RepID=UPI00068D36FA|nr:phosphoribosyltransferase family protein [Pseudidiomarina atlantica]